MVAGLHGRHADHWRDAVAGRVYSHRTGITMTKTVLKDGGFSCTPAFAVKVAHMMSCAQAAFDEDSCGINEVLYEYLSGQKDEQECIDIFQQEWPKAFPGLHTHPSK
jgi:hypothetical protein